MERSDTERLCQDFLQPAGQGGHLMTPLAFLMPGNSLLSKHGIYRKISRSGIHSAGQGLTLSSCERQVILCDELGTVKAHRNVELCTLTRAHLTIMGCPASNRASGFIRPCHPTYDCINKYLSTLRASVPFLLGSKKKQHLPMQIKVKGIKTVEWEADGEHIVCLLPGELQPTLWRRDGLGTVKKDVLNFYDICPLQ